MPNVTSVTHAEQRHGGVGSKGLTVASYRRPSTVWSTLRMPWSWHNYCHNHCTRTCCSHHIITRCHFTNWPIRCKQGGKSMHFLSTNLIGFRRSSAIVLVMTSLAQEMDSTGRQWNTEKDVWNVRDFSAKGLPSGGTRCMPQQMWHAVVCANWEQKIWVFWSNLHCDWPHHWQRASSSIQHLWLARFVSVWKALPGDITAQWDWLRCNGSMVAIQPQHWECMYVWWCDEQRVSSDLLHKGPAQWGLQTLLLVSYPDTEYVYMMYLPPSDESGAHWLLSGSCSLPQLWPAPNT